MSLAEGPRPWAIPVFCLGECLRVLTHRRLFDPPYLPDEAVEALRRVLASPSLRVLLPGEHFLDLLAEAMRDGQVSGNLVFDAQIVALCREAGVNELLTEDRDFARFRGFRTRRLEQA